MKKLVLLFAMLCTIMIMTVPASASTADDLDDMFARNDVIETDIDSVTIDDNDASTELIAPELKIEGNTTTNGKQLRFIAVGMYDLNYIKFEVKLTETEAAFEDFTKTTEGELTTSLIWANPDEELLEFKWTRTTQDDYEDTVLATINVSPETTTTEVSIHVVNCIVNCHVTEIEDSKDTVNFDPFENEVDSVEIILADEEEIFVQARTKNQSAVIIVALYDTETGQMLNINTCPISTIDTDARGAYIFNVHHSHLGDIVKVKVMLVDEQFRPLCKEDEQYSYLMMRQPPMPETEPICGTPFLEEELAAMQ